MTNTVSWASAVNGDWNVAANWLPARVPGTNDLALINISGNYTVSLNGNASVRAFQFGASGGTQTKKCES